jgi:glycosyltransferase involved in cell wall biosynthesis
MNKKVIFIADFFVEQIVGGGELNNKELISLLKKSDFAVTKIQSHMVNLDFVEQNVNNFFIVSNFVNLTQDCRDFLTNHASYIIYEHDHKYLASRNAASYKDFKAPITELRNYFFYKHAQKVVSQSHFHKEIIEKNLDIDNVVTAAGNLWSLDALEHLRQLAKQPKAEASSIMKSLIPHKNTAKAAAYCKNKELQYELVSDNDPLVFLEKLGKNKSFVFFPGTPETLSRIVVEARMMGMSVVTNDLVGATGEDWFKLKGEELIDYMVKKRKEISNIIIKEIRKPLRNTTNKKISIFTTFYEAEEYLNGFLEDITNLDMFDECELIIVDTASPGNEKEIVESYLEKHDNIRYYRYEERLEPTQGLNVALMKSLAPYVTWAMIDDRKSKHYIKTLYNVIHDDKRVDLVYGDCLTTSKKNETFIQTESKSLLENSSRPFSKENMIKCLPGPMPLWRRGLHEKYGFFDHESHDFAADWDMWLRAVSDGSKFKKVDKIVGLYKQGGRSQQEYNLAQRKEEATLFFKYAHIFGANYQRYVPYFKQFLEM